MDKQAVDNRADQMNPNNENTGPGQESGYQGTADKADLDNHANQLNPNNEEYGGGGGEKK